MKWGEMGPGAGWIGDLWTALQKALGAKAALPGPAADQDERRVQAGGDEEREIFGRRKDDNVGGEG